MGECTFHGLPKSFDEILTIPGPNMKFLYIEDWFWTVWTNYPTKKYFKKRRVTVLVLQG